MYTHVGRKVVAPKVAKPRGGGGGGGGGEGGRGGGEGGGGGGGGGSGGMLSQKIFKFTVGFQKCHFQPFLQDIFSKFVGRKV